jgi:hypothetical protein
MCIRDALAGGPLGLVVRCVALMQLGQWCVLHGYIGSRCAVVVVGVVK